MSKNFTPEGQNKTPFNPQLEHFDYICGQIIQENKMLKFVTTIAAVGFILSIAICFYAVTQPETVPVLINLNEFGESQYIGKITKKNYQNFNVPEVAVVYQVKKFLQLKETLSTDREVMRKSMKEIYGMLTSNSSMRFNNFVKENDPYKDFGYRTKELMFQTEPLRVSTNTYQVDYQVTSRSITGGILETNIRRAIVTTEMLQPSEEDIKTNPLGIYITNFDIQKLETQGY